MIPVDVLPAIGSIAWRELVVAEARSWFNTPYHHCANVKGAGIDCLMLLVEVYRAAGVVSSDFDPRPYSSQWFLHRGEELFLDGIIAYAQRVETPQSADVAMYRFGRTASHGAIVVDEHQMIHAHFRSRRVELCELDTFKGRLHGYYRIRGVAA